MEYKIDYKRFMELLDYGDTTYVVGHKSPDTDSACSAIAYARLKQKLGINAVPVLASKMNAETEYVLNKFNIPQPEILDDASGKHIIIVDHSSYAQAVDGMEEAHIVELIDHHGRGNMRASDPLIIKDLPVGATATIVYICYMEYGVEIDKGIAGMLVSALLSDTANLTSPTTTSFDKEIALELAKKAEIEDIDKYYEELAGFAGSYFNMTDEEIFYTDYKEYEIKDVKYGVACVIANEKGEWQTMCRNMLDTMAAIYEGEDVDQFYCMVNDVYQNDRTFLLRYGDGVERVVKKAFDADPGKEILLSPAASRKKDIIPPLEEAYREIYLEDHPEDK